MIVYLVGPRACGKTSIGQELAARLDIPFADTDIILIERAGMDIATIVEREGWDGFRRREYDALREVSTPPRIVATGGGIILNPDNCALMRERGTVIYLSAPAAVLAARLESNPDHQSRPSLTGKSITDEITDILTQREALYQKAAHHVVDASRPLDAILDETARLLG